MASAERSSQFLGRIVEAKRSELAASQLRVPQAMLEKALQPRAPGHFQRALLASEGQTAECAIIAEVKKASPSRGVLCSDFHPAAIARSYRQAGRARFPSSPTAAFFQGSLDDLKQAKAASSLPVLRKDFTLAEYHVYEAAAAGADAVLLIVAILEPPELKRLLGLSRALGLDALVEVHSAEELRVALDAGSGDHWRQQPRSADV